MSPRSHSVATLFLPSLPALPAENSIAQRYAATAIVRATRSTCGGDIFREGFIASPALLRSVVHSRERNFRGIIPPYYFPGLPRVARNPTPIVDGSRRSSNFLGGETRNVEK